MQVRLACSSHHRFNLLSHKVQPVQSAKDYTCDVPRLSHACEDAGLHRRTQKLPLYLRETPISALCLTAVGRGGKAACVTG